MTDPLDRTDRAAGLDAGLDRSVSVRTNPVKPPDGKSFSQYLRDSLLTDLKAAGKYDAASPLTVRAELTENELNAGISAANAVVAARFRVLRSGQTVYDKLLRQSKGWRGSFMGAVAIPEAINQYTAQYPALLAQLYADPEFLAACRSTPP